MNLPQPQDRAYMGQFLRALPEVRNIHTFIHGLYKTRYAFARSATVVQQKKFPDVSFYQGSINWNLMQTMTDAVIIRAGQNSWVDTEFNRNWIAAKVRGMKRGVYWFYDGRKSPSLQADLLVSLIKSDLPEMEIWIDWETNYGGSWEGLLNVVTMMQRVETLLPGARVGIYTGYYWFIQNSNPISNAAEYGYLKNKPLWLAWYTTDASIVKIPQPWSALLLWQFGTPSEGALHGVITPTIDMNYFNGTLSEFTARYGAVTPPPPPTGATQMKYTATATSDNTRLRPESNVNKTYLSSHARGTKFDGDVLFVATAPTVPNQSVGDKWLQVKAINGVPFTGVGWVAITHQGAPVCTLVENVVPPPPAVESIYISHTFTDTLIVEEPDGSMQTYSANWTMPNVEYKPNP